MSAVEVPGGLDAGAIWHYGDPLREQRRLSELAATVDLRHRPVFSIAGPDRLTWLHALTSQQFTEVAPGSYTSAYILDPHGHIEHAFGGIDDGETFWAHTEPGRLQPLLAWLDRMVFASRVEVIDRRASHAVLVAGQRPAAAVGAAEDAAGLRPWIVGLDDLEDALGESRAGTWALDALRIAAGAPRAFCDTDEQTIPNEVAVPDGDRLGSAVHLKKGCYRGQETVGRTHTMGRPPRRLVLLHLDGSVNELPPLGAPLAAAGETVGRVGSSSIHHELGPIALGLVRRALPVDATLDADGIAAAQQVVVDPEVGLHRRPPKLGPLPGPLR